MEIKKYLLNHNNYYKADEYSSAKSAIVLHHTVSGGTAEQVVDSWNATKQGIGTCYVIGRQGEIIKAFESSKDWGYHLGETSPYWKDNAKRTIAIEMVAFGGLTFFDKNNYKNAYDRIVDISEVDVLAQPFRGFEAFHKYTDKQVASLIRLLGDLCSYYAIPRQFAGLELIPDYQKRFEYSGIMSHTNFRNDKSDIYPSEILLGELHKFCSI